MPVKIFISSVQNELQSERRELARFIQQDALLQKINTGYIEQVGTGTNDMINCCVSMGLQRPEFYQQEEFRVILWRRTGNETGNEIKIDLFVKQVIVAIGSQTLTARSIKEKLGLRGDDNFRKNYLTPALESGYIAMLYPENPKRKGQAYYLTGKGLSVLENKLCV
ncbi:MAG: hypothetical protein J5542_04360 [Bacteroidales bacterium]|nr:hypothetical protein [Bacteroidales bacterium]